MGVTNEGILRKLRGKSTCGEEIFGERLIAKGLSQSPEAAAIPVQIVVGLKIFWVGE